jgi:glycosyltransferase involved in cell wall biosynthesis
MPAAPAISVIIPALDAEPTLERTLAAVLAQDPGVAFETIVVDDGSTDRTTEIVERHGPDVRLVRTSGREGPGAARNHGVEASSASLLAFTDADCFPAPGWLRALLDGFARADLIQGSVQPDPTAPRSPFDRSVEVSESRGLFETANVAVRRSTFEATGGFRDWSLARPRRMGPDRRRGRARRTPIGEDTVFAWETRRRGARTAFIAEARVFHAVIPGSLADDIADRWHWGSDLPGVVDQVPELRDGAMYRRWFFHARTADFDFAMAAIALALTTRRWWPLIGTLRYARWMRSESMGSGLSRALMAGGVAVGDAVTAAALVRGSLRWRTLLL